MRACAQLGRGAGALLCVPTETQPLLLPVLGDRTLGEVVARA